MWTEVDSECRTQQRPVLDGTNFEMRNLSPETYYRIEIRAHNAIGLSQPASLLLKTARGESTKSYGTLVYRAGYTMGSSGNSDVPKIRSLLLSNLLIIITFVLFV